MKMHHIGIIVKSIEKELPLYQGLGYRCSSEPCEDAIQHNRLAFLENSESGELLELIEPMGEESSVSGRSPGLAHICYVVPGDFDAFVADFRARQIGLIFTEKLPAPALGGKRIVFALLKNKMMVEFLEE